MTDETTVTRMFRKRYGDGDREPVPYGSPLHVERMFRKRYEDGFYDGVEHVDAVKAQVLEILSEVEALVSGFGRGAGREALLEELVFECCFKSRNVRGTVVIRDGDCVIQQGSESVGEWASQARDKGKERSFRDLHSGGTLVAHPDKEGRFVFASDYSAGKPSRAAALICGRSADGPKELKETKTGKTYDELKSKYRLP